MNSDNLKYLGKMTSLFEVIDALFNGTCFGL